MSFSVCNLEFLSCIFLNSNPIYLTMQFKTMQTRCLKKTKFYSNNLKIKKIKSPKNHKNITS